MAMGCIELTRREVLHNFNRKLLYGRWGGKKIKPITHRRIGTVLVHSFTCKWHARYSHQMWVSVKPTDLYGNRGLDSRTCKNRSKQAFTTVYNPLFVSEHSVEIVNINFLDLDSNTVIHWICMQGRSQSQTLNPGWARKQHFLNFSSFS